MKKINYNLIRYPLETISNIVIDHKITTLLYYITDKNNLNYQLMIAI